MIDRRVLADPHIDRYGISGLLTLWGLGIGLAAVGERSFLLAQTAIANLAIFMGYLFVAVFIAPWMRTSYRVTKLAGAVFFLTCGITHFDKFIHVVINEQIDLSSWYHVANHNVQSVAVWTFVLALWIEFVRTPSHGWPPRLDFGAMLGRNRRRE